jgi:phosphoribosylaminoimidazolecarboxamide formyltransferase/IMP cyclohydrolase
MGIKSMYKRSLKGNKPVEVNIELVYQDGSRELVPYMPALVPERYGTNPHQLFALLVNKKYNFRVKSKKPGSKGFSFTNIEDSVWGAEFLKFIDKPCCIVMKHENPSGAASIDEKDIGASIGNYMEEHFLRAWYCDFRAAFGSVVAFNRPPTKELAQLMIEKAPDNKTRKYYIEVVAAPDFEEGAMGEFNKVETLRVLQYDGLDRLPKFDGDEAAPVLKTLPTMDDMLGFEDRYLTRITKPEDLLLKEYIRKSTNEKETGMGVVTQREPTKKELEDLLFGWYSVIPIRSNATAIVKNGCLISPGTGQQARVASVIDSVRKVEDLNRLAEKEGIADKRKEIFDYSLSGSVLASEALFPFPDSVEVIGPLGITAVVQPGGSERDADVVSAANKFNMSMTLTGERCFSHH